MKCVCVAFVAVAGRRYTYTVCTNDNLVRNKQVAHLYLTLMCHDSLQAQPVPRDLPCARARRVSLPFIRAQTSLGLGVTKVLGALLARIAERALVGAKSLRYDHGRYIQRGKELRLRGSLLAQLTPAVAASCSRANTAPTCLARLHFPDDRRSR